MIVLKSRFSYVATIVLVALFIAAGLAPNASAQLALTSTGTTDGFSLSTFATLDPGNTSCCGGPFGIAVAANGDILVSNANTASIYAFHDVDGQTILSALSTNPSNSSVNAYATAGGQAYGVQNSQYVQFNSNGTVNHVLSGVGFGPSLGMWGNPVNGHILAQSGSGIIDINPTANGGLGTATLVNSTFGDGLSVSPDGLTVYSEQNGHIIGYSIATGLQVFDSGFLPSNAADIAAGLGNPDGAGVITSTNSLNGDIVVNFNGNGSNTGGIGLINPVTHEFSVIATGGTRGDYVSPDTNNGSLFLDYSDIVARLSCGANCSIGGPPPVPEPASLLLLGFGLAAVTGLSKKKRKQTEA